MTVHRYTTDKKVCFTPVVRARDFEWRENATELCDGQAQAHSLSGHFMKFQSFLDRAIRFDEEVEKLDPEEYFLSLE